MINYDAVNSFIGKDWVYLENDCWELVRRASSRVFGLEIPLIPLPEVYSEARSSLIFMRRSSGAEWEKMEAPEPGCIVLFYSGPLDKLRPSHIGLYIEHGNILHCDGLGRKTTYDELKSIIGSKYKKAEFFKYVGNRSS